MGEPIDPGPDDLDTAILSRLRGLYRRLDPPPPDLNQRVLVAMAVANLDAELASLQEDQLVDSGARATERVRRMSFDAPSITIMVTVTDLTDGGVRLDGWLAPPARSRIELRLSESTRRPALIATADEAGRFAFPTVPRGPMWLVVTAAQATVVTPSVTL
jgi:hypothetical protein